MERVFLDANVLFSAAYRPDAPAPAPGSGLRRLWKLRGVALVSSAYAVEEARINLDTAAQRLRLAELVEALEVMAEPAEPQPLPAGIALPAKDQPILRAAIAGGCAYLLTGDVSHFGAYFGRKVGGVTIQPPAVFLAEHHGGKKGR